MLFDTDVLIWVLRGNQEAAQAVEKAPLRQISVVTYMELLQGARNRREIRTVKAFLADCAFQMLPLTENVGHRAAIYMEEYGLKVAMCVADALLAATAVEAGLPLCTGNRKHYSPISDLAIHVFRPYQPVEKGDWLRSARREPREKRRP
jgi:predicted nucleic acid-binding protein